MLRFPVSAMHLVRCLETASHLRAPVRSPLGSPLVWLWPKLALLPAPCGLDTVSELTRVCLCLPMAPHAAAMLLNGAQCGGPVLRPYRGRTRIPLYPCLAASCLVRCWLPVAPATSDENGPTCCRAANCSLSPHVCLSYSVRAAQFCRSQALVRLSSCSLKRLGIVSRSAWAVKSRFNFVSIPSAAPVGTALGDEGTRTPDFLLAKQALSQLSYIPVQSPAPFSAGPCVGQTRLELVTSRLSAECSNQLSY